MKLIKKTKLILLFLMISTIFCVETVSETDDKIKTAIHISEGNMKHKKQVRGNQNFKTTAPGSTNPAISPTAEVNDRTMNDKVSRNGKVGRTSNVLDVAAKSMEDPMDQRNEIDLDKGPIFYTAWVQYFKYFEEDLKGSTPRKFFSNNVFFEQMKLFPNSTLNETSSDGVNTLNQYIKDPTHFYAVLFRDTLNLLSSRDKELQKTIDILNLEMIKPVAEVERIGRKDNGITDFGDFSEGFCFKITTERPNKSEIWIICCDSKDDKQKLMEFLRRMTIKHQRNKGLIVEGIKKDEETISDLLNPLGPTQNLTKDAGGNLGVSFDANTQNITDGYWIVLQSWSQCSLKCGGGISTFHRMCVPPKNGGKECQGEAIITKPCNTQPCPNVLSTDPLKPSNTTTVNKPIVKVMPFSNRPQRYSKCVIKESDLMLSEENPEIDESNNPLIPSNSKKAPKLQVPVRVVMNNRTVIIFGGEDYNTQIKSFSMSETLFKRSITRPYCFILSESKKRAELCPFFGCTNNQMVEEWDYDFNLFKYQCWKPRDEIDLKERLEEKMKKAKKELLEEREDELKRRPDPRLDLDITNTNKIALQAIQKELNLEEMIRKEEREREEEEELEMLHRIDDEKRKSECLMRAIRERQLENQYNLRQKQAQEEMNEIKNDAAQQVIIRRSLLKNKIIEMRKRAMRRKRSLDQQLLTVRNVMAENMGKAYRKGDCGKCIKAMECQANRENYCDANFVDDFELLTNCKEADDFYMICADNEFGEMFIAERHQCYKDLQMKDIGGGRWIWQNEIKREVREDFRPDARPTVDIDVFKKK